MPLRRRRKLVLHTDGASRGNPGAAAIGVVIKEDGGRILELIGKAIGRATNNVAEYTAVITALDWVQRYRPARVVVRTDSLLVVEQLAGHYAVRHPGLLPLYQQAKASASALSCTVQFQHVPRAENQEADALANAALDCQRDRLKPAGDRETGQPRLEESPSSRGQGAG